MTARQLFRLGLFAIVAFALGLVAARYVLAPRPLPQTENATLFPNPRPLPALSLVDQDGRETGPELLSGHWSLVFFGFTHCPDVCPTTLHEVSEILRSLGKDADRVRALFVTVDPERDTPDKLKDYLSSFDPHLVGVTGDAAAITAIGKAYRVYAKKVPLDGGGYTMDHTAIVYLMGKDGRFVAPFNIKRRPEEAAADLRRYL
jgi:protein SCO1/2